jgi:aerotaxis receptor
MLNEYILKEDDFLVSETDRNGKIIFANEDFCRIAGYTLEELIGKPHSVVRHSDMPRGAFADLWNTVRQNRVWTGYVKNRTKDGGFYWVYATVYPMKGGQSYMSCRRKASAAEVATVRQQYETLWKESA